MSKRSGHDDGPLPDKLTLKPSPLRWLFVFAVGVTFAATAIFVMTDSEPLVRWAIGVFFGIVAVVAIPSMFGVSSRLDLDREGLTCVSPLMTFSRKWAGCSAFGPVSIGLNGFVGFSSATDEAVKPKLAAMSRSIIGASGMLPVRYGMSASGLADLMNRFRARAIGG